MSLELSTTTESSKSTLRRVIDWTLLRRPQATEDSVLSAEALVWLHRMPIPVRPLLLSRRFPRIVNRLANEWSSPKKTIGYFESLLLDERGTRKGFPLEILQEIVELKAYYVNILAPAKNASAWDDTNMF